MSEKLLKALMELFAIIANINQIHDQGKNVVRLFLKQQVNLEEVDTYLHIFDEYYEKTFGKEGKGKHKRTPVSHSVQALVICSQINTELSQRQKYIILIRLLEFINTDEQVMYEELEFVETVALAFNIEEQEFQLIKDFVLTKDIYLIESPDILVVDDLSSAKNQVIKYISLPDFPGHLSFLHIKDVDIYIVRYRGTDEVLLNGLPLQDNLIYPFVQGSVIRSPRSAPIYYSDIVGNYLAESGIQRITFVAKDIEHLFGKREQGLHQTNLAEETGKLVGIMGASGAGKTTLLNVLSGLTRPAKGKVLINNINMYDEPEKVKGLIGYISQDDLLIEELTVYQNLYYNAQLCLGWLTNAEIEEKVHQTLKSLGLYEIKDLTVGDPLNKKISGGQRKRLNIALEIIREPHILFVDEPTSGLSSRDSENIMDLLKELSLKGKLVIVVIHQPSSDIFKMFDRLLILDQGGYQIFYGNPIDSVLYFREQSNFVSSIKPVCSDCGNVNPEQIFNIVEAKVVDEYGRFTDKRKVTPQIWSELFQKNFKVTDPNGNKDAPEIKDKKPTFLKQVRVFFKRNFLAKLANTQYMIVNFSEAPFLAIILAFLVRYFSIEDDQVANRYIFGENQNMVAFLFMSVVVSLFLGMSVSAEEIIKDQKILKRETFLNLSKSGYLLSKILILFGISAIQMLSYVLIGNWILGIEGMHFDYWLVLFSTACFANMLGLNISASFNSAVTIYILIPILLIPQLLLSGAIVKFEKLNPFISSIKHVPATGDIMASKWAFEALAVNQFKNNAFEQHFYDIDKDISHYSYKSNFLYSKLKQKFDYCLKHLNSNKPEEIEKMSSYLLLLRNEINKDMITNDFVKYENPEWLNISGLDSSTIKYTLQYLDHFKDYYATSYNRAANDRDKLVKQLETQYGSSEAYNEFERKYHNKKIKDLVTNRSDEIKLVEYEGEYLQKIDPVFQDPPHDAGLLDFRTHLFIPEKPFLGKKFDTFYFNISMLWFMSLLLYIALYFDVLKKLIHFMETRSGKKQG